MRHRYTLVATLWVTLGILLAGCGEDRGDIEDPKAGDIVASFEGFSGVSLGERQTRLLRVTNVGEGTLRIRQIDLVEARNDEHREFFADGWMPGDQTLELEQSETLEFGVSYAPQDSVADEGLISIYSNDPSDERVDIELRPEPPSPEIFASPSSVIYQSVPPVNAPDSRGEPRLVDVQNVGEAPLRVDQIFVADSDVFSVTFPQPADGLDGDAVSAPEDDLLEDGWPASVAPGESFPVRVWFRPDDRLPESGALVLKSNDPRKPRFEVPLSGNSGTPCLNTNLDQIAFGQSSIGQTTQMTVTFENCSRSEDLEVSSIALTDDGGGAFDVPGDALPGGLNSQVMTVPPREQRNFVVTFEPNSARSYTGQLVIESNDPAARERTLPVTGTGTDNNCPIARATATSPESARPQTTINAEPLQTINFDGTDSTDPDGDDSRLTYEWTVLSRPQGSTQRTLPVGSPQPRMFIDLAGVYEVELKVFDAEGAVSCGDPAIITINAIPLEDVHIQLVWDTPADPDQTDNTGTDLDLHYMHPFGQWDTAPWDVFWRNVQPDWGVSGDPTDDPSLDIDDTDGAGPENINHNNAENLVYQTGVYYFADRGMGASYATVRIYVFGALQLEIENKFLPRTGTFWRVGEIEWPGGGVQSTSRIYDGFPNR